MDGKHYGLELPWRGRYVWSAPVSKMSVPSSQTNSTPQAGHVVIAPAMGEPKNAGDVGHWIGLRNRWPHALHSIRHTGSKRNPRANPFPTVINDVGG